MSKHTKIWLIIAASLVLIGCVLFVGVMVKMKWNFRKLSTIEYETNTYEITDAFDNISLNTNVTDVTFLPSEDGVCKIVCYEESKEKHAVSVENNTLTICTDSRKKWYDHIGINLDTPKLTVYLPESEYGALHIQVSTGTVEIPKDFSFDSVDISSSTGHIKNYASCTGAVKLSASTGSVTVADISAQSLDISVSTGKVKATAVNCRENITVQVRTGDAKITDTTCKSFSSKGSTGDLTVCNVIASEQLFLARTTGDIELEGSDATEIVIKTTTGDVEGSLMTEKVFLVQSDTGDIDVPKTAAGGRCEITTDTGDIEIVIDRKS